MTCETIESSFMVNISLFCFEELENSSSREPQHGFSFAINLIISENSMKGGRLRTLLSKNIFGALLDSLSSALFRRAETLEALHLGIVMLSYRLIC